MASNIFICTAFSLYSNNWNIHVQHLTSDNNMNGHQRLQLLLLGCHRIYEVPPRAKQVDEMKQCQLWQKMQRTLIHEGEVVTHSLTWKGSMCWQWRRLGRGCRNFERPEIKLVVFSGRPESQGKKGWLWQWHVCLSCCRPPHCESPCHFHHRWHHCLLLPPPVGSLKKFWEEE